VNYDQLPNAVALQASGYHAYSFGVRYARKLGYRLSGTVDLTYTKAKTDFQVSGPLAVRSRRFSGHTADAALDYRLGPRTQVRFEYVRGVQPAQVVTTGFDVSETLKFSASRTIGRRLQTSVFASQVRTNYSQGELTPLTANHDEVRMIGGSASLDLGRHVSLSLDAQHLERSADVPLYNYKSDRIGITLAVKS
jgi:hypothetical protein